MKRILQFLKTLFLLYVIGAGVYLVFFEKPAPVRAFTDSSPIPLPWGDTTVIPNSGDACGAMWTDGHRTWYVPNPGGCSGSSSVRTFYRKRAEQEKLLQSFHESLANLNKNASRHKAVKRTARTDADFEVTFNDMQKVYTYNADFIESLATPIDVQMDLGLEDPELTTAQHWTLPAGLEFSTIQRKILDPQYTPYGGLVPDATHCLYVKPPNRGIDMYTYYLLDEDGLWLEGANAQGEGIDYASYDDDEIMTLPLDYDTDYQSGSGEEEDWTIDCDTTWYDDTAYEVEAWYFWSEGYGTLDTPDEGTVEVIKIAYQWIWSFWEVDEESEEENLVEFDNGTEVYFYSKLGHQVMVFMDSLGVQTSGIVKPDMIYYQKVRQPGTLVNEKPLMIKPDMQFYPNPSNGMIRFTQPTTFELFDILGRSLMFEENALQTNLSHLPRGLYFMKPHKGNVQKVLIQK